MPWQITGYLPRDDAERFRSYAVELGIDKSALANLLIHRELQLGRLAGLRQHQHSEPRARCTKVTAHLADSAIKLAFNAAAQQVGLVPGAAASILFRAELSERWLARSIRTA